MLKQAMTSSQSIQQLIEQMDEMKHKLMELSIKFDVWQSNVDPMLSNAQTAMNYDSFILTVLAIALAVAGIWFQWWSSKSKKDAVVEAIKAIENTIAKGILPDNSHIKDKLIQTIINSDQFIQAARKTSGYLETADAAEREGLCHPSKGDGISLDKLRKVDTISEEDSISPNGNSTNKQNK